MSEENVDNVGGSEENVLEIPEVTGTTLADIGAKTIGDLLRKTLAESGIKEAVGFEIVLRNGATHTILSDSNPVMQHGADEVASVKIKQSAEAGIR